MGFQILAILGEVVISLLPGDLNQTRFQANLIEVAERCGHIPVAENEDVKVTALRHLTSTKRASCKTQARPSTIVERPPQSAQEELVKLTLRSLAALFQILGRFMAFPR